MTTGRWRVRRRPRTQARKPHLFSAGSLATGLKGARPKHASIRSLAARTHTQIGNRNKGIGIPPCWVTRFVRHQMSGFRHRPLSATPYSRFFRCEPGNPRPARATTRHGEPVHGVLPFAWLSDQCPSNLKMKLWGTVRRQQRRRRRGAGDPPGGDDSVRVLKSRKVAELRLCIAAGFLTQDFLTFRLE